VRCRGAQFLFLSRSFHLNLAASFISFRAEFRRSDGFGSRPCFGQKKNKSMAGRAIARGAHDAFSPKFGRRLPLDSARDSLCSQEPHFSELSGHAGCTGLVCKQIRPVLIVCCRPPAEYLAENPKLTRFCEELQPAGSPQAHQASGHSDGRKPGCCVRKDTGHCELQLENLRVHQQGQLKCS
jgi:hypothetical protein